MLMCAKNKYQCGFKLHKFTVSLLMFSVSPGSDRQLFLEKVLTNPKYTTCSLPNSTGYLMKEVVAPNHISSKMAAVKQVCCMNS